MELTDLLQRVAAVLDQLGVPYAVVGSMASSLYGEPRLTNDVDVLADLRAEHAKAFVDAFSPDEFYVSAGGRPSAGSVAAYGPW